MKLALTAVITVGSLAAAQNPKPADNCTPPPSALAPTMPAKLLPGMGAVHLPITTSSPEAQRFFDQGLAQMHSFWAREAERSFLQAAALDPQAPMPQWGIAMVAGGDWRPRFQIDVLAQIQGKQTPPPSMLRAQAAAKKAVELSQTTGTDLEKLYVAAVAARRNPDGKGDTEDAFVKGTRAVLAKYPDEVEAQLDLALMIMRGFSVKDKKPRAPGTTEAVAILRSLLVKAPDHPGVHHYIIHGFEGSSFAKDAWPSCEKYTQLVTNIPHALHMPGHIYSQTGRWEDAAKAFSEAAVNERMWMKLDKLYGQFHHGHNVHYLATAYSFEGRYDDAVEASKELLGYPENPAQAAQADLFAGAYAQGWFGMLRTQVQFQKWDALLDDSVLPVLNRPRQQAWRHWARAVAYAHKGDIVHAADESRQFELSMAEFRSKVKRPEPPELKVARRELAGHLAVAEGHLGRGLRLLEAASQAERRLTYTEPPFYPRPVAEALGEEALKNNKPAVAEKAFKIALSQYPGDSHAETKVGQAPGLRGALSPALPPTVR
jgi:tetratricopeptide (TPR) repeat protein